MRFLKLVRPTGLQLSLMFDAESLTDQAHLTSLQLQDFKPGKFACLAALQIVKED